MESGKGRTRASVEAEECVAIVCAYVRRNYSRAISNETLASLIDVSPSYLIRLFKHVRRMSPQAYVRRVRMTAAIRLSRAGYSQRQIAALIGFSNKSHLSRSFRRTFGVPLGAYIRARSRVRSEPVQDVSA